MNSKALKTKLFKRCKEYVAQRIATAKNAMDIAQKAASEESKTSMGDKYETSKALMHIEKDKAAGQLSEAIKLDRVLNEIQTIPANNDKVDLGNLVLTTNGNFYISISVGKLTVANNDYFVISLASPVGQLLYGLKVGEEMSFNKRTARILEIV